MTQLKANALCAAVLVLALAFVAHGGQLNISGGTGLPALIGTSGSIGGGLLTIATCASGNISVTGATTGMAVAASPVAYPGDGILWLGYVSSAGTVTVKVCALGTLTPTSTTYNIRVSQ